MRLDVRIAVLGIIGLVLIAGLEDGHSVSAMPKKKGVKSCECSCEKQIIFKAVGGSGRNVYNDYLNGGDINGNNAQAKTIESPLPYRNSQILDMWDHLDIEKVRVEVYDTGTLVSWVLFNGRATTMTNWFTKANVIASIYDDLKTGSYNYFSIEGDSSFDRRFFINRKYGGCPNDCGYLDVKGGAHGNPCDFDKLAAYPYFLYGKKNQWLQYYV